MRRSTALRKKLNPNSNGKSAPIKQKAEQPNETSNIAKSAFIGNISHEIRTPMNAIMGFAQMLKNSNLNEQQSDFVDVILDSGKKLLLIINNLLDLSNLQLGKSTLNLRPSDPAYISDKLWQHFRPLILAKKLNPILECDPDLPKVMADCEKIERVVGYIISNAIKYTSSGFITFRTGVKTLEGDRLLLCLEVSDSGIGIPEDQLESIFDVFEQGDNSITRSYGGMGIGLSISRQIVALMGGNIRVQSKVNEGSRFFVEIPVLPADG